VNLTCEATGSPKPQLRWRRADGEMIRYQGGVGKRQTMMARKWHRGWFFSAVASVEGNWLRIANAGRAHIGTYYCIASNGVPPTKSKTIRLRVQCKALTRLSLPSFLEAIREINCRDGLWPFYYTYTTLTAKKATKISPSLQTPSL